MNNVLFFVDFNQNENVSTYSSIHPKHAARGGEVVEALRY
jgi:hypothetical protein